MKFFLSMLLLVDISNAFMIDTPEAMSGTQPQYVTKFFGWMSSSNNIKIVCVNIGASSSFLTNEEIIDYFSKRLKYYASDLNVQQSFNNPNHFWLHIILDFEQYNSSDILYGYMKMEYTPSHVNNIYTDKHMTLTLPIASDTQNFRNKVFITLDAFAQIIAKNDSYIKVLKFNSKIGVK